MGCLVLGQFLGGVSAEWFKYPFFAYTLRLYSCNAGQKWRHKNGWSFGIFWLAGWELIVKLCDPWPCFGLLIPLLLCGKTNARSLNRVVYWTAIGTALKYSCFSDLRFASMTANGQESSNRKRLVQDHTKAQTVHTVSHDFARHPWPLRRDLSKTVVELGD